MSHGRRTQDRRRRVLYSAHQADLSPDTAASRREAQKLREARRPPAAYGSRVHRRLRGRWFSLVPVRRRTLVVVALCLASISLLLCMAHYAAVAWPSIANHPEIARPLRLDHADSFGRWYMVALLSASAGVSLLIYQLRRYRNDDFQGHYRLWRLVLIVVILASVNSLVSLMDWSGALLDAGFGKRVALTGSDWIRLVVSLGGAVLALRLVAEVRRCRVAVGMMVLCCAMFAIPEAAKWNMMKVDTLGKWTLATSAPLLGCTAWFISLGSYLRMLFREVKQINDSDSLRDRFQRARLRLFQESDNQESDNQQSEVKATKQKPAEESDSEPRRRWFGLRRAKPESIDDELDEAKDREAKRSRSKAKAAPSKNAPRKIAREKETANEEVTPAPKREKKRRFSMRLAPPKFGDAKESPDSSDTNAPDTNAPDTDASDESKESGDSTKRRRGLGWLRRKKAAESVDVATAEPEQPPARAPAKRDSEPTETIDPDEIDWNGLSKAERRRLRKQLKRQNRAA